MNSIGDTIKDKIGNPYIIKGLHKNNVFLIEEVISKKLYVLKMGLDNLNEVKNLKRIKKLGTKYLTIVPNISFDNGIVFEYIDGIEMIKLSNITNNKMFKIMHDLIHQMIELHDAGIYHRNIKPENILVDKDSARFIDFGSSIHKKNINKAKLVGSILYMSPKLFKTNRWNASTLRKIDTWALGISILRFHPRVSNCFYVYGKMNLEQIINAKKKWAVNGMEYDCVKKEYNSNKDDVLEIILHLLSYDYNKALKLIDKNYLKHATGNPSRVRSHTPQKAAAAAGRLSAPMVNYFPNVNEIKKYRKSTSKDVKREVYLSTLHGTLTRERIVVHKDIMAVIYIGKYGKNFHMDDIITNDIFFMNKSKLLKRVESDKKNTDKFYNIYLSKTQIPNIRIVYKKNDKDIKNVGVWGLPLNRKEEIHKQKLFEPTDEMEITMDKYMDDFVKAFGKNKILIIGFDKRAHDDILNDLYFKLNQETINELFPNKKQIGSIKKKIGKKRMPLSLIHGTGENMHKTTNVPNGIDIILLGYFGKELNLDQILDRGTFFLSYGELLLDVKKDQSNSPNKRFYHIYTSSSEIPNFELGYSGEDKSIDDYTGIWAAPIQLNKKIGEKQSIIKNISFRAPNIDYGMSLEFYINEFVRRFGTGYTLILGFCKGEMSHIFKDWEKHEKDRMEVSI